MQMPRFADVVADLVLCVTFFTRVPLPLTGTERRFADALWAAPIAGALVGLAAGIVLLLGLALGLPPLAAAILGPATSILLTGALHEDGAADLADGFGGGGTREDIFAIMRDSRIGSYGTLALILSVLARTGAVAAIIAVAPAGTILVAMMVAHMTSRAVLPAFAAHVPPASASGLSAGLGAIASRPVAVALGIGALVLLFFGFRFALVAILLLGGIFFAMAWLCRRRIGGQTGDVLGALQQACEVVLLLAMAAVLSDGVLQ